MHIQKMLSRLSYERFVIPPGLLRKRVRNLIEIITNCRTVSRDEQARFLAQANALIQ